ncbi:MAG: 50S rRNA methyltransferase [Verrucomicrobia bacterium]|nr:50S rRNA methyltransferase [Verrucomicrobiota bacterium]
MTAFVSCGSNLEELLTQELKALGISSTLGKRGVFVPQEMDAIYRINYESRLASRVLWPLVQAPCRDRQDLYKAALSIDWSRYISSLQTFAIDVAGAHPAFTNTLFAAMVVKDAICDHHRKKFGSRPNVDVKNPDVQLHLLLLPGKIILSFDTSGSPLYKRGYRIQTGIAPLQESLAAAVLQLAGLTSDDVFCDPFCGSGTFLIEAAMKMTNTPAGYFRQKWGFEKMPQFSASAWKSYKESADKKVTVLPPKKIFGSDLDRHAVVHSRDHVKRTGFAIEVASGDAKKITPPPGITCVATNPPYGKRITADNPYADLGVFLSRCAPSKIAVLCASDAEITNVGIPLRRAKTLSNGGLEVSVYLQASEQKTQTSI